MGGPTVVGAAAEEGVAKSRRRTLLAGEIEVAMRPLVVVVRLLLARSRGE
jgi:hypothetical protein